MQWLKDQWLRIKRWWKFRQRLKKLKKKDPFIYK